MFIRKRRGQTTAEYAILFSLVLAAAIAMQVYVKRGMQARIKKGTDAFTGVSQTFDVYETMQSAEFAELDQYEPYYQVSDYDRYQENIEQEHMDGTGKIIKEKVSDIAASKAGGYDMQSVGITTRDERDALWEGSGS